MVKLLVLLRRLSSGALQGILQASVRVSSYHMGKGIVVSEVDTNS